jgi:hypothetical protein
VTFQEVQDRAHRVAIRDPNLGDLDAQLIEHHARQTAFVKHTPARERAPDRWIGAPVGILGGGVSMQEVQLGPPRGGQAQGMREGELARGREVGRVQHGADLTGRSSCPFGHRLILLIGADH